VLLNPLADGFKGPTSKGKERREGGRVGKERGKGMGSEGEGLR